MTNASNKKFALIAGASRGIGKAFYDHYRQEKVKTLGISLSGSPGLEKHDLLDENATYRLVKDLDLQGVDSIVYLHSVGIDKFEPDGKPCIDHDGDGIDDEVYASNVTTFLNLAEPLIDKVKGTSTQLTIVNIGSVSDIFKVPYWQSFSRAKNKVRQFARTLHHGSIKSVMLNVSSTLDDEGRTYGRKCADTTYWQTARELCEKSHGLIELVKDQDAPYVEADFFKPDPKFRPDYFTDLPRLYKSWQRDMGFEGRQIPPNIRI